MKNDTIEKITNFLFINKPFQNLKKYDVVIVLGNNHYLENALVLQMLKEEKKINENTLIVITGNKGLLNKDISVTEADLIYSEIVKLKLNLKCVLEKEASNIKENLLFSSKLLGDLKQYNRILLVGKAFASRRILMCADAIQYPLDKVDIYGLEVDIKRDDWFKNPKFRKRVLEELGRIERYTLKGDIKM